MCFLTERLGIASEHSSAPRSGRRDGALTSPLRAFERTWLSSSTAQVDGLSKSVQSTEVAATFLGHVEKVTARRNSRAALRLRLLQRGRADWLATRSRLPSARQSCSTVPAKARGFHDSRCLSQLQPPVKRRRATGDTRHAPKPHLLPQGSQSDSARLPHNQLLTPRQDLLPLPLSPTSFALPRPSSPSPSFSNPPDQDTAKIRFRQFVVGLPPKRLGSSRGRWKLALARLVRRCPLSGREPATVCWSARGF